MVISGTKCNPEGLGFFLWFSNEIGDPARGRQSRHHAATRREEEGRGAARRTEFTGRLRSLLRRAPVEPEALRLFGARDAAPLLSLASSPLRNLYVTIILFYGLI